ncbi:LLM class flavin-dependent oxidoreductase [Paenibacillus radicis (ex Xue et al. 2023)]|uniref:LLM class flavin-dependent oxidoreductase n=1 Tax=Paenibacillus radicis (ex Xue et al. 2023) TaxID=2972489 RepID=A0ABT1YUI3_9BACL|nr:LLM class flavin-dependent oxidoreductase [Paenibacillus radicis (ex Xue et al. 2023)]MCR8635880.1 LLM class flavin-dependent oxidoreductase [Paenibacillus radicis (ex Xue et al. 2023)]
MGHAKKQLHLGVFLLNTGQHTGGWRHPETQADRLLDLAFYQDFARLSERGKFDTILILEQIAIGEQNGKVAEERSIPTPDTLTLLSIMASATEKIGLTATLSTTYNDPFYVAARFATLDHLSRGRAGWNMVTSQDPRLASQFSKEAHMDHALRYDRANEFVDVAMKLWDSLEEDALLADRSSGHYFNPAKVHDINHSGDYFAISGSSYVPHPLQGYPVLFQAGSSGSGLKFAAQKAEVVFTAQDNLLDAQAYYANLKGMLEQYGRRPDQLHILPGLAPILGSTEREAKEREEYFNELVLPEVAVRTLSGTIDVDLSAYPLDGPFPYWEIDAEANNSKKSRLQLLKDLGKREKLTVRQMSRHVISAGGHHTFAGTPEQLADLMEEWLDHGACDGFNIMPSHYLRGLEEFVDHVVPILQQRGRYRTEYTGSTLRDHLGLANPANRWSAIHTK